MKIVCLFLLAVVGQVYAVEAVQSESSVEKIVVQGSQKDIEINRDFVAGKLVIGRKRLEESGKQSVDEVLRSEPAISVGKDGRIGLLGLPGYTQVLVDGKPPALGDPMALDLTLVEKIEIIKSATAETGPFGIAGTINIIRRKIESKVESQLKLGVTSTAGYAGENLSLFTNHGDFNAPFSYQMTLLAGSKPTPSDSQYQATLSQSGAAPAPQYEGERNALERFNDLILSNQFAWKLNAANRITFSPEYGVFSSSKNGSEQRAWVDGPEVVVQQNNPDFMTNYSLPLLWDWQLESGGHFALKASVNRHRRDIDSLNSEIWSNVGPQQLSHKETHSSLNHFLDMDFNSSLDGGHDIKAGAKLLNNEETSSYADLTNGTPDAISTMLGTSSNSQMQSIGEFVQDDWRIDKGLAFNLGASAEQRNYKLREDIANNLAHFNLFSPSVHVVQKVGEDNQDQIRASLAQTFQAPFIDQMLLHPQINPLAPCALGSLCTGNTIDTADSTGNPHLLPERSVGLNLSYAHEIGANSELLIELYSRDIADKIGNQIALEDVAWSSVPRYVISPANLGQATVCGVNLEGRVSAPDIWMSAPKLELLGSLGFAHSELSDVPGPNNRLDGQTPWRAKLAANYIGKDLPLKLGVDANWLPSDWVRNNVTQSVYQSRKFTLNANASWKFDSKVRLSVNLDNLVPEKRSRIDEYQIQDSQLQLQSIESSYTKISARLEMNF